MNITSTLEPCWETQHVSKYEAHRWVEGFDGSIIVELSPEELAEMRENDCDLQTWVTEAREFEALLPKCQVKRWTATIHGEAKIELTPLEFDAEGMSDVIEPDWDAMAEARAEARAEMRAGL